MAKSMGSKAGLTRKKVQVRLKSGKTIQRSMMVRAGDAAKSGLKRVGGFVNRHKGKIAGAAMLAGAAYMGVKHGSKIAGAARGFHAGQKAVRDGLGAIGKKASITSRLAGGAVGALRGGMVGAGKDSARTAAISGAASKATGAVRANASAAGWLAGRAGSAVKSAAGLSTRAPLALKAGSQAYNQSRHAEGAGRVRSLARAVGAARGKKKS